MTARMDRMKAGRGGEACGAARDDKGWSVITAAGRNALRRGRRFAHLRLGNGERRAGMPALHTATAEAKATTAKAKATTKTEATTAKA